MVVFIGMKKLVFLLAFLSIALFSCRKEDPIAGQGVQLKFSTDTVFLDTVFTSIGSSTYNLRVFNPSDDKVILDRVQLSNPAGFYSMNVNGTAGNDQKNVEILGKDSIHIFIEVKHNKKPQSLNFIAEDSIIFVNKGVTQNVKLVTTVRDAYFHFPNKFITIGSTVIPYSVIAPENQTTTLPNDKPHVIYGYAVADENSTLNILGGTELYFHQGSGLWVYEGSTLKVAEGATSGVGDSVTFAGDRLEPFYEDAAGQWGGPLGGIFIQGNTGNHIINNAVIKNATTALQLDSSNGNLTTLTNSWILNSSRVGIYGGFGNLEAENVVVANSGLYCLYAFGGSYDFNNCTFANYWQGNTRSTAAVTLSNYLELVDENNKTFRIVRELNQANFNNCLMVGNNQEEFTIIKDDSRALNYFVQYSMLDVFSEPEDRAYDVNDPTYFDNIKLNLEVDFVNTERNNYALDSASQAVDQGNPFNAPSQDILGNFIFGGLRDMGAYERQFSN